MWLVVLLLLLPLLSIQSATAEEFYSTYNYRVLPESGGILQMNVSMTTTLYYFYKNSPHPLVSESKTNLFNNYITPEPVRQIAELLRGTSKNDEDFVNQVLRFNRQHVYDDSGVDPLYPIETLGTKSGDCDTFSYMIASILIAGGVDDVALLTWKVIENGEEIYHMNIGVYLPSAPTDYGVHGSYYIPYNEKNYYIAECTGNMPRSPSRDDYWRLGNLPETLEPRDETFLGIIVLSGYSQTTPSYVYASFADTTPSAVQITSVSAVGIPDIKDIVIEGVLECGLENEIISLYYSPDGDSWNYIGDAITTTNGEFTYSWDGRELQMEICIRPQIKAFWSGNTDYSGGESYPVTTIAPPLWLIVLSIVIIVAIVAGVKSRKK